MQATMISFGQTEEQKQIMYEYINSDSRGSNIQSKIAAIKNKEDLFSEAQILPVYQVVFDKKNNPTLVQQQKYYLVFYIGRLYQFINNHNSRLFENSPIIKNLLKFNIEKKKFKVVYFTKSFSWTGENLKALFTDDALSYIIDKEIKYSFSEFIDYKYGSTEKLKEFAKLDVQRDKLTVKDVENFLKSNYTAFEYNCPKDTTLVLKTLVNQIRIATKDFSIGQELKLISIIKQKLNPFKEVKKSLTAQFNDSIKNIYDQEIKKMTYENQKNLSKISGNYEYKIYGVSITNELLEIFTNKQFIDYVNYINLLRPAEDSLNVDTNKKYRYDYGIEVLKREAIVKNNSFKELQDYKNKFLEDCGCPFDTSVKREIILR